MPNLMLIFGLVLVVLTFFDRMQCQQLINDQSSITRVGGRISHKYMLGNRQILEYEFNAGGKTYTSNNIRLGSAQARSCTEADFARFNEGQPVAVFFKKADPNESYLIPSYDTRGDVTGWVGMAMMAWGFWKRRPD